MTQHAFQTEVTQLLQLMIHSLYSEREIFLRELISNASDACDKLRFLSLTEPNLSAGDSEYRIELRADKEAGTLTLIDNGVGLTEAEAIEHLGTIAKSGTKAFLGNIGEDQKKNAQLIGQFGVGFYAAFMVADKVVVESRSARLGSSEGVRWESTGDGNFATEKIERAARGTTVTLHLKDDAKDFIDAWKLRALVKKWSDYISYPIRMAKEDGKSKEQELEQVNSGTPLWTKPRDSLKDEDYTQFYRSACKQWDEPATRIHASVEGRMSYTTLLFVPSEKPFDLFERERRGVSLYVKRVFIMDDCKHLLPEWLRFMRGVVDSDDLPLNVSREILQQQSTTEQLRKQLTKRVVDHLLKLAQSTDEAEKKAWTTIDTTFGAVIREGIITDPDNKDRAARLARWRSSWTEAEPGRGPTSLEDYVRRAPEGQKEIWFVTAPNLAAAKANPAIEGFVKAGREVLFFAEPVDEFVVQHLDVFDSRKLSDAAKGAADLGDAEAKKVLEAKNKELEPFLGFAKTALGDGIAEVRLTGRLADSPCCLVGDDQGVSGQMEAMMRRMGQNVPAQKHVLELNPGHPLVQRLTALYADAGQHARVSDALLMLRDQATLAAGGTVSDGAAAAKRMQGLMTAALG